MPEAPTPEWLSLVFWAQHHETIRDLVITSAALLGVPFVIWREWLHHRQTKAALEQAKVARQQARTAQLRHEAQVKADRERRITDNFTRAVELLGSDQLETRLGAIYSLERIARESPTDHWPIMETLTAYVRERAPWPSTRVAEEDRKARPRPLAACGLEPATDIQAILTVIGRRNREHEGNDQNLDLTDTNLRGANLRKAHLENATLDFAHLERADLREAHLEGASLCFAHLERAYLENARLAGALFLEVNLQGAVLEGTDLTYEQLYGAFVNEETRLPSHINRPDQQGEAPEAQHEMATAPNEGQPP